MFQLFELILSHEAIFHFIEIFVVADRKIRDTARGADELSHTERVKQIAELFSKIKIQIKKLFLHHGEL